MNVKSLSVQQAIFVVGPTASGKSAVAIELAARVGGEIVNADPFQLCRGLDICSAKPSACERATVPHHLFDVLDASETCDAQRLRELALPVMAAIVARGRWPIIVSGSGLYVKALTHGLAPLPKGNEELRERLARMSHEELVAELLRLDPAAADNVPLTNDRYVSRALEICLLSGRPQSELRKEWMQNEPEFMGVFISRERDELYQRINERVLKMLADGLVAEIAAAGDLSVTAGKAIGVREMQRHLHGECSLEEAVAAIQQATRRYAKRQITWFKRERGFQTICLDPHSTARSAAERILETFPCLRQSPLSALSS